MSTFKIEMPHITCLRSKIFYRIKVSRKMAEKFFLPSQKAALIVHQHYVKLDPRKAWINTFSMWSS